MSEVQVRYEFGVPSCALELGKKEFIYCGL